MENDGQYHCGSLEGSNSSIVAAVSDNVSPQITISAVVRLSSPLSPNPFGDDLLGSLEELDGSISLNEMLVDALTLPAMGERPSTMSADDAHAVPSFLDVSSVGHPTHSSGPPPTVHVVLPAPANCPSTKVEPETVASPLTRSLALSRSRPGNSSSTLSASNSVLWNRQVEDELGAYPPELADLLFDDTDWTVPGELAPAVHPTRSVTSFPQ